MGNVIGICGGSGSGKSTLAAKVAASAAPEMPGPCTVLQFDSYYRDHGHLPPAERAEVNYDHPDSLDVELFVKHLDALRQGHSIDAPVYDFTHHTRSNDVVTLVATPVIVAEGILLLAFSEIRERFDLAVFRECPEDVRLARRLQRDIAERGRTPEAVLHQFHTTVAPMHDEFVEPFAVEADIVVRHGETELDEAAGIVTERLRLL